MFRRLTMMLFLAALVLRQRELAPLPDERVGIVDVRQ